MKQLLAFITIIFCSLSLVAVHAQEPALLSGDIKGLVGKWKGSLTYMDYSSGKPYTMPANLTIHYLPATSQVIYAHDYPNEPRANSADTVVLSPSGRMLGDALVQERRQLNNGRTTLITESMGTDGNDDRPARIRITHTWGPKTYSKRKEVQFEGTTGWLLRHEYSYNRD